MSDRWQCVLTLDSSRHVTSGNEDVLVSAIRAGADLRVGTAFRHNEHIDPSSSSTELIREVMDFRIAYLIQDRFVAGIENLRMPVQLPGGFGPRESMSFFLYNQDGHQAIARPFLDGQPASGEPGPASIDEWPDFPKYHELTSFDAETNAPSSTFVYDFEYFRYFVRQSWREVLSHNETGQVVSGDVKDLVSAFEQGAEIKVAIRGLCSDFDGTESGIDHEVFIHAGACYFYTDQALFIASLHPVVRTCPSIPLGYQSRGWDFGWLMPRTDGHVARWLCDPYTLKFHRDERRYAIRWFVSE
ncbi:MAG: hypothetical protein CMJ78_18135 [Planctomycetaceae bacterium]|nr:hypothetical protein [Planctomycetaceae bacterium]